MIESLTEGDRSLNSGSPTAACVMFGRALEALCRDVISNLPAKSGTDNPPFGKTASPNPGSKPKRIMLGEGIKRLLKEGMVDQRLYDWSLQLQAFRNLAAHPDDAGSVSMQDASDLQTFVFAIVEYIYDLTDRYNEFLERIAKAKTKS